MKKLIISTCMFVFILLSFVPTASSERRSRDLMPIYAKAQQGAIKAVLTCFRNGASTQEWGKALQELVRAEIGMINYGVSYKSDKLYSKLASNLHSTQYPLFGFRVFEVRLKNAGYEFSSVDKSFTGRHLLTRVGTSNKTLKIEFK